jgi:hypothetical protein
MLEAGVRPSANGHNARRHIVVLWPTWKPIRQPNRSAGFMPNERHHSTGAIAKAVIPLTAILRPDPAFQEG